MDDAISRKEAFERIYQLMVNCTKPHDNENEKDFLKELRTRLEAWFATIPSIQPEQKTGITIPDNATNGDMIKVLFPDTTVYLETHGYGYIYSDVVRREENYMMTFNKEWWNAPYKREEE